MIGSSTLLGSKVTVLLVFLLCFKAMSQETNLSFEHLTVNDGLSQNSVLCLLQDDLERIWIGTREGLNCYDGERVHHFHPLPDEPNSIMDYKIIGMEQLGEHLFILGASGVSILNIKTQQITRRRIQQCTAIKSYRDRLYMGTESGMLYSMDTSNFELTVEINIKSAIRSLSGESKLLIGTPKDGLFTFDVQEKTLSHLTKTRNIYDINDCLSTGDGKILVATEFQGLFYIDASGETLAVFNSNSGSSSLLSNTVRTIVMDESGKVWIGTFLGINVLDIENQQIEKIVPARSQKSLNHSSVFDLMIDRQQNLWVGTYFGGANYANIESTLITYHQFASEKKEGIGPIIGRMIEDADENLWIATESDGLLLQADNSITYGEPKNFDISKFKNVRALAFEEEDYTIYAGTHYSGLIEIDLKTGEVQQFDGATNTANPKVVNHILQVKDELWLGTRNGIYVFDKIEKKFHQSFDKQRPDLKINESIYSIHLNGSELWIGTESSGIIQYHLQTGKLKRYTVENAAISSNSIYSIFQDSQDNLWFGSQGGGLFKLIKEKGKFKEYGKDKNGLPSDFIEGIIESENGNLWIATSSGLSLMEVAAETFTNYSRGNGFPYAELNQGGLYLSRSGRLFIGSLEGLISVDEKQILSKLTPSNLILSSLFVNDQKVNANETGGIITQDISATTNLILQPKHTSFSIEFASCNFKSTFNHYRYKLEGFDEDWIANRNSPSATYTSLPSGSYEFIVQTLDPIYKEPLAERRLSIRKVPPIYATWYASLFYLFLFLGVVYLMINVSTTSIKLRVEQKEKANIQDLNLKKIQFFTNISHEFMTPITLIIGSIESLFKTKELSRNISMKLKTTYESALRLQHLSSELMDFRKLEQGYLKFSFTKNEIGQYLNGILTNFKEGATQRSIQLSSDLPDAEVQLWFDKDQMSKVFFNLISNAFKFVSENKGIITISVKDLPDAVEIYVEDNGTGIPKEAQENIFDRFYQAQKPRGDKQSGSGLGLAISEGIVTAHEGTLSIHKSDKNGSIFKVKLLKGIKHLASEFLDKNDQSESSLTKPSALVKLTEVDFKEGTTEDQIAPQDREFRNHLATLMIVEDNQKVSSMLDELFHEDYNVLLAEDGQIGIEMATKKQPDIIITDLMMPNVSGSELCASLKSNPLTSHIPIIMLTAKSSMNDKLEGLNLGADDYLTKPFSIDYLKTRVSNLFENRRRIQEKYRLVEHTENLVEITQTSVDRDFMEKLQNVVEVNIENEGFDVNDFARTLGISRTLFFKKVKSITGQTPNDFLQLYRLKKSAELLKLDPNANVSEISYKVGFSSPKYFSRRFKLQFGLTPSEYKSREFDKIA